MGCELQKPTPYNVLEGDFLDWYSQVPYDCALCLSCILWERRMLLGSFQLHLLGVVSCIRILIWSVIFLFVLFALSRTGVPRTNNTVKAMPANTTS